MLVRIVSPVILSPLAEISQRPIRNKNDLQSGPDYIMIM